MQSGQYVNLLRLTYVIFYTVVHLRTDIVMQQYIETK